MDESRDTAPQQPCICGSHTHRPLREAAVNEVGFLRCPDGPVPRYVQRGVAALARGICWAVNPDNGLHCTEPPHAPDTPHRNAYAGGRWMDAIQA